MFMWKTKSKWKLRLPTHNACRPGDRNIHKLCEEVACWSHLFLSDLTL